MAAVVKSLQNADEEISFRIIVDRLERIDQFTKCLRTMGIGSCDVRVRQDGIIILSVNNGNGFEMKLSV